MTDSTPRDQWLARLAASRTRVLECVREGGVAAETVYALANREARLALTLCPMPIEPVAHIIAAHARARPYLERLCSHDPSRAVAGGAAGYTYTPRKVLRRVLDHAVDHLDQIEQWLRWRREGTVPIPADGWAGSTTTLEEDHAPLSSAELAAWLWRIDTLVGLVATRAGQLRMDELDWRPPEDAWSLRHMLHHLAGVELFYVVWLNADLPADAAARYAEASRRLHARLLDLTAGPLPPETTLFGEDEAMVTPAQLAAQVLTDEQAILAASR